VPNCTKDKANDPIGVCSVFEGDKVVVTCPVRFRQDWIIAEDAARFFFPEKTRWTTLTEVRLKDAHGASAGNIDVVLCAYDATGKVTDFGALEVQAVYISGNIRKPFEYYMENPTERATMDWESKPNYPRPDYLSSSRKRLAPQLIFKGGIIRAWNKKTAVALHRGFFDTLPELKQVPRETAEMAWLVYDLERDAARNEFVLTRWREVYTKFDESLDKITHSQPGRLDDFLDVLQHKVNEKLENGGTPPDVGTIDAPF
jgi:hypothetical protein